MCYCFPKKTDTLFNFVSEEFAVSISLFFQTIRRRIKKKKAERRRHLRRMMIRRKN